mmetsp:Transcript_60431/g.141321  ORF Transcript_60431/g.141321 Transcript_60431/m.141321 type:complete len:223 (+) Transcript_60431:934-1602(+)
MCVTQVKFDAMLAKIRQSQYPFWHELLTPSFHTLVSMPRQVEVPQDSILLPMASQVHQTRIQIKNQAPLREGAIFLVILAGSLLPHHRRLRRRTLLRTCALLGSWHVVAHNQIGQVIITRISRPAEKGGIIESIRVRPVGGTLGGWEPLVQVLPVRADNTSGPPVLDVLSLFRSPSLVRTFLQVIEKAVPFRPLASTLHGTFFTLAGRQHITIRRGLGTRNS